MTFDGWAPWGENSILVDDYTIPLPDAALVRGPLDIYLRRNSYPQISEVGLWINLWDGTIEMDSRHDSGQVRPCGVAHLLDRQHSRAADRGLRRPAR